MTENYSPVFIFFEAKSVSSLWRVFAAAFRSRSLRSGRPISSKFGKRSTIEAVIKTSDEPPGDMWTGTETWYTYPSQEPRKFKTSSLQEPSINLIYQFPSL